MERDEETGPNRDTEMAEDELSRELRIVEDTRENVSEGPEIEIKKGRKLSEDIIAVRFHKD